MSEFTEVVVDFVDVWCSKVPICGSLLNSFVKHAGAKLCYN